MNARHSRIAITGLFLALLAASAPIYAGPASRVAAAVSPAPPRSRYRPADAASAFPPAPREPRCPPSARITSGSRTSLLELPAGCSIPRLDSTSAITAYVAALEPGFPVQSWETGGTYMGGPGIHTLVGNIDTDPELEIVVTALGSGPLYAWNWDGAPVPGWPLGDYYGAGYAAMGELDGDPARLEVVAGYEGAKLVAYSGAGEPLAGWPRSTANFVAEPPALGDVNGDGLDEIFTEEEDWRLHGYRANGTVLPGWPKRGENGQERHTPALADLDGDCDLEILTASGHTNWGVYLFAYHHTGAEVAGFPVIFEGRAHTFPAVGDVDGDESVEIVVVSTGEVLVYSGNGTIERSMTPVGSTADATAPALADMDGDRMPEIIVQTSTAVNVWRGNGEVLPGWPYIWGSGHPVWNSSPVVGDVDGDQLMEIVATTEYTVQAFNHDGTVLTGFPLTLIFLGNGAVPAIADIDLDKRNEIIITGAYWPGHSGYYDKVWAFDLGGPEHGPIEWGQFGGGPRHQGFYPTAGPDLSITLADSPDPVAVEGLLTYTLTLTNGGSLEGTVVMVTDTLPVSVSLVVATPSQGPGCGDEDGVVTCDLGTLREATTATVTLLTIVKEPGVLTNRATLGAREADLLSCDNAASQDTVAQIPITGLAAANDGPTPLYSSTTLTATLAAGSGVTYTWALGDGEYGAGLTMSHVYPAVGVYTAVVTAANRVGEITATTAVTVDEVIAGLAADNDSPTALGGPTTLTATLAAGSNVTYRWAFGDGTSGSGRLTTHVYPDPKSYPAVVTAHNSVSRLAAATVVEVEEAIAGLRAANDGPTWHDSPTILSATIAAGSSVTYSWSLGDGQAGSGPLIVHTYAAPGLYTAVVTARNRVGSQTAATPVTVAPLADLALACAGDEDPALAGGETTYTLVVTNAGPSAATGVILTDWLPPGTLLSAAPPGCAGAGRAVTCTLGTLDGGDSASLAITAAIQPTATGVLTNTARVAGLEADPDWGDNAAVETTAVVARLCVYTHDFQTPAGDEWSDPLIGTTPSGRDFLGDWHLQTVDLTLNDLPVHTRASVVLDLYAIRAWEGNALVPLARRRDGSTRDGPPPPPGLAPDIWTLTAGDGEVLVRTTFSNRDDLGYRQSYPSRHPGGDYPARTGAKENQSLGYEFQGIPMDSVYRLVAVLEHTADSLVLEFAASGLAPDASWGIDNIEVCLDAGAPRQGVYLPLVIREVGRQ